MKISLRLLPPVSTRLMEYKSESMIVTANSPLLVCLLLILRESYRSSLKSVTVLLAVFGIPTKISIVGVPMKGVTGKLHLFLVILSIHVIRGQASNPRPEEILLSIFSKPLAPTDGVSRQCAEDSLVYLNALKNYTPWALQS